LFEEAKQEGVAIFTAHAIEGFVEQRADLFPIGQARGIRDVHEHSLLFAFEATAFSAEQLERGETRGAMQPAGEDDLCGEGMSLAREVGEDDLGCVPGEVGIATGLAEGRRIDQIDVPGDEFAESSFRTLLGVAPQKLLVIPHCVSCQYTAAKRKTGQNIWRDRWTGYLCGTEFCAGCVTACNRRKVAGAYRAALLFVCGSTSFMDWVIKSICFICCCR
jgi:hypothetical protein